MRNMNCRLLANFPTCLLAYLPTCQLARYTHYAFSAGVSSPVSFLLVPFIVQPFRPVLIVSTSRRAIREAGRFFLIRSRLVRRSRIPSCSAPFSSAHSFRHLVMPSRPIVSSGVCNEIFCYLTFHMLNTKK